MKTAIYFTSSFKPTAKEAQEISELKKKYRFVSVRNSMFYKKDSNIKHSFDDVFGCVNKNNSVKTSKESDIKKIENKPATTKPWERNK